MTISFEPTENTRLSQQHYHGVALEQMRPISRKYDEHEHDLPQEWVDFWWKQGRKGPKQKLDQPTDGMVTVCIQAEELCWGDAALYLRMPTPATALSLFLSARRLPGTQPWSTSWNLVTSARLSRRTPRHSPSSMTAMAKSRTRRFFLTFAPSVSMIAARVP